MSSDLTPEEHSVVEEELVILEEVVASLKGQSSYANVRLNTENQRARELTSELVAARRDEDKAMLASDEAVSHVLRDKKLAETKGLKKLIEKPYFARFVVEEAEGNRTKSMEYRLGFTANPDCRIVDWRKAPISKLYYEYREGDEYSETIQEHEREGKITLRNALQIEQSSLKQIRCRYGMLRRNNGDWIKASEGSFEAGERHLKSIVSLITPEQFQTITEDADTAILIQGIAGSGKTTVAMHRLAWLLHEDNSDLSAEDTIVIVLSNAMKTYVSQTLPSMGIGGVEVYTFREWAAKFVKKILPQACDDSGHIGRPEHTPLGVTRLKGSFALLWALEDKIANGTNVTRDYQDLLLEVLSKPKEILERDDSKLLDQDLIRQAWMHTTANKQNNVVDFADDPLILRTYQLLNHGIPRKGSSAYGHIVVDEVQDLSPPQLASLVGSVKKTKDMTLVGDTAQKIDSHSQFPGWEKLRKHWSFDDDTSRYLSLSVSHRSTLPIMTLADYVQKRKTVTEGRKGRVPIWFHCNYESKGISSAINWLEKALEKFPNSLTAVVCADPKEARHAESLLSPTFEAGLRLGDEHSFSFEEGIVVTDVKQVKGLEFTNVLIWNPTTQTYPNNSESQNRLYVAITRAEENLCIVTWKRPSKLLPHIHSKLIRGIDMTIDEL